MFVLIAVTLYWGGSVASITVADFKQEKDCNDAKAILQVKGDSTELESSRATKAFLCMKRGS